MRQHDGPQGHYDKGNKSDRERQTHDLSYIKSKNNKNKLIDTENRLVVIRDGGWRTGEMCEILFF